MTEEQQPGQPGEPSRPGLHCTGGAMAPAPILDGFRMLLSLPDHASLALWPLIVTILQEPEPDPSKLAQQFAQQHNIEAGRILNALFACDYLLRQAAALNISAEEFQQDLQQLGPGSASPAKLLMPNYRGVMQWLRAKILEDTLADHGKVFTGLHWRVEQLRASNHGAALDATVLHLNLRYREGKEDGAVRLQLSLASARALKDLIEQVVGTSFDTQQSETGPVDQAGQP